MMTAVVLAIGVLAPGASAQGQLYNCFSADGRHCWPPPACYHGGDSYQTQWPGGAYISEIRPRVIGTGRVDLRITDERGGLIWQGEITVAASWAKAYPIGVGRRVPERFHIIARSLPALQPDWHHGPYTPPPLPRVTFTQAEYATGIQSMPGYLVVRPEDAAQPPVSLGFGLAGSLQTLQMATPLSGPTIDAEHFAGVSLGVVILGRQ